MRKLVGILAVVALLICLIPSAEAALIRYSFTSTITGNGSPGPIVGGPIGTGDTVSASFLVDDSVVSTGYATYAYRENAVVGASVTVNGMHWTLNGSGDQNYISMWNDEPIGVIFDGFWISAPLTGPSLNGYAPWTIGFVLFSYLPGANPTLSNLDLPRSLDVADFNTLALGSLAFANATIGGRFDLRITDASAELLNEVPEPSTLALGLTSLAIFAATLRPSRSEYNG